MTLQDDADSSVNVTGTDQKIDAPLTQACSPDVHEAWTKAKCEYARAERALAMAQARLTDADRAKQAEWKKMVERALIKSAFPVRS